MITRSAMLGLLLALGARPFVSAAGGTRRRWQIPAEASRHARCWMAWPARSDVWGKKLGDVRAVCARVARAIVRFEPVTMVAPPEHAREAAYECGPRVRVAKIDVDDCWMRDTGPLMAFDQHYDLLGCVLNFNGWGNKQSHNADATVAARICGALNISHHDMPFVSEGGAWDFDGEGTALTTESAVLNSNRNPGLSKRDIEAAGRDWL